MHRANRMTISARKPLWRTSLSLLMSTWTSRVANLAHIRHMTIPPTTTYGASSATISPVPTPYRE